MLTNTDFLQITKKDMILSILQFLTTLYEWGREDLVVLIRQNLNSSIYQQVTSFSTTIPSSSMTLNSHSLLQ